MLRVLLGANLLALAVAFIQSPGLADWMVRYVEMAALVEPLLLLVLGAAVGVLMGALRTFGRVVEDGFGDGHNYGQFGRVDVFVLPGDLAGLLEAGVT